MIRCAPQVYATVTWALVWCLISAPFLFKWALRMFVRANPVQRAESIGGMRLSGQDFIVRVLGPRKKGMLHDVRADRGAHTAHPPLRRSKNNDRGG